MGMYTLPLCQSIYCYLSLQIQVYSEFRENPPPHAWDQNKRRTIEYHVDHDNDLRWDEVMTFMKYYSLNTHTFIILSWAEYVFISTFLARIFWSANWTNTIYRSVSCLLVHQEKTAEKSTRQSARHRPA